MYYKRQLVCFAAKEKKVKSWQLPRIEPSAPSLSCQCSDHWAMTTGQPPASQSSPCTFLSFTLKQTTCFQLKQDVQEHSSIINYSPGRFQNHKNPAALPDPTVINLCGNVAYDQVRPGTTGISLHGNAAYECYNHEQNPADDDQYENLDEYNT